MVDIFEDKSAQAGNQHFPIAVRVAHFIEKVMQIFTDTLVIFDNLLQNRQRRINGHFISSSFKEVGPERIGFDGKGIDSFLVL